MPRCRDRLAHPNPPDSVAKMESAFGIQENPLRLAFRGTCSRALEAASLLRLARPEVATALDSLMTLADQSVGRRTRCGPKDSELCRASVCHDHLAGERGVVLFGRLCDRKMIALSRGHIDVTPAGEQHLTNFGIDVTALRSAKRPLCRSCLDWSERAPHLAGAVGAALLYRVIDLGWARRIPETRIVRSTSKGHAAFSALFLKAMR